MISRTFTAADPRQDLGRFSASTATISAMLRRAIDIMVSATALAFASPILLVAALAIRLESPGPIIYRQRRSGLDGHEFDVLKLRTMVDGAEHKGAGLAINENDSRITRVGSLLRRTSLDELPNLVNVLRGEMSLIGPRPTLPVQVELDPLRPRQRRATVHLRPAGDPRLDRQAPALAL
jgi:lipopolysaccharide/colanic/teichoic acid biosynthesis glycosyltransferase